jgi:DNA-binding XRE family transcriptional regulator
MQTVFRDGRECVIIDREVYEDLLGTRSRTELTAEEMACFQAANTPVAFWRKRSGKTQAATAAEIGVSQPFLAQIEAGKRSGTIGVLARLAKALGVRIDDLVAR